MWLACVFTCARVCICMFGKELIKKLKLNVINHWLLICNIFRNVVFCHHQFHIEIAQHKAFIIWLVSQFVCFVCDYLFFIFSSIGLCLSLKRDWNLVYFLCDAHCSLSFLLSVFLTDMIETKSVVFFTNLSIAFERILLLLLVRCDDVASGQKSYAVEGELCTAHATTKQTNKKQLLSMSTQVNCQYNSNWCHMIYCLLVFQTVMPPKFCLPFVWCASRVSLSKCKSCIMMMAKTTQKRTRTWWMNENEWRRGRWAKIPLCWTTWWVCTHVIAWHRTLGTNSLNNDFEQQHRIMRYCMVIFKCMVVNETKSIIPIGSRLEVNGKFAEQ